ncbi:flagellar transcriptional regulator FlhC [Alcaligenaceae bacterium SJ-26]|nr:flagellar transcriptional regulator FlhC [Alcaligenaceae bacterium SJ-26]
MTVKSVRHEAHEIELAASMIELGARLQMLQAETSLSRDRLARLYREIRRMSPPKGMLPFSVDWHMTWLPNIHSSLFYGIYRFIVENTPSKGAQALVDAYRLYLEQAGEDSDVEEPVLSFTRAWMLVRFFDNGMVQMSRCTKCNGHFVAHAYEPAHEYVCGICRPPPRAGKTQARTLAARGQGMKVQAENEEASADIEKGRATRQIARKKMR